MTANFHSVSATGKGGELEHLRWTQSDGEMSQLIKAVDGWVLTLGGVEHCYHIMNPCESIESVYRTEEGKQYEARTINVGKGGAYYETQPNSMVVLEGEGDITIDDNSITVKDDGIVTRDGEVLREGDTIVIKGRKAKVAQIP
jgi:mannose-6-phosphate isomerase-like protein (cupin superfamily)